MAIIVHGGAGSWGERLKDAQPYLDKSARWGLAVIKSGRTATEAVVEALSYLEDTGFFNAGRGAYPQSDQVKRLDAGIMNSDLDVGGVIGLENNPHAIQTAYDILIQKRSGKRHSFLMNGKFLGKRARPYTQQPAIVRPYIQKPYSVMRQRRQDYLPLPFDTIGAVALDLNGLLAAGASTGGVGSKSEPGRIGDAAIMGLGYYAQGLGAATTTGQGEYLMKVDMSFHCVEYINQGKGAGEACEMALNDAERILGKSDFGGIIALNSSGEAGISKNTKDLPYSYMKL